MRGLEPIASALVLSGALLLSPLRGLAESRPVVEETTGEAAGPDDGGPEAPRPDDPSAELGLSDRPRHGEEDAAVPPPSPEPRPRYETVVRARAETGAAAAGRASSSVDRRQMDERVPRSAPDALRYEPGAFVQQTAHGQASTFVRGLTGQQTLLLFDGIRLNNSTYRQGPNQHFFTVDARTVSSIEVVRGSASVVHGSDALGGAVVASPLEPVLVSGAGPLRLTPRTAFRLTTADDERGGRFELEAQVADRVLVLGGVGYRTVGLLEGGGVLRSPADGAPALVPRMGEDGRSQLGTGFDELTFDGRLVALLGRDRRLVAALYGYRQYDSPRTDQCPAAHAPWNECLTYEEQFRTLAYVAFEGDLGPAARALRLSASYQRQHERRRLDRPSSFTTLLGRDDVDTMGLVARAETARWRPLAWLDLGLRWGADLYLDWIGSASWTRFTDVEVVVRASRGLYLDGSRYLSFGAYAEGEARLPFDLTLRAGGRLGAAWARAPGDEASSSQPVDSAWFAPVGRAGLEWAPRESVALLVNLDQGYRAPNLDDLTSRQQTGPGFQLENPGLGPERSLTLETGVRLDLLRVRAQAFVFWTRLDGSIQRAPRTADECPDETPGCASSWTRFQLDNAGSPSDLLGAEVAALFRIPAGFRLALTLAYAWGEGPNPGEPPSDPAIEWPERVPLSRVPPLNGTVELRWYLASIGVFAGAGLRWALAADRLAPSDLADARIPAGGTPGFAVLDLRLGWRFQRRALVALVVENVTDEVYRYHGSSVNGPGRGAMVSLELGL